MPIHRNSRGQFLPGNSGRKRGALGRVSKVVRSALEEGAVDAAATLTEAARSGDVKAALAIIRLVSPPPRDRLIAVDIPVLKKALDAPQAIAAIAAAAARAEITASEAASLTDLVDHWRTAHELADLEQRIKHLEERER